MPWTKIIEIGTASGIVGGAVLWLGSKLYATKKDRKDLEDMATKDRKEFENTCATHRKSCQEKICFKIDKIATQIEINKLEIITHRDKMEEKLSAKVEENRKVVSEHYSEVKHALGLIQGQLGLIERIINNKEGK